MINLKQITVRNFLSWGDYDTVVSLSNRGQCFIAGEIDEYETTATKSNGAGKCLAGDTLVLLDDGERVPIEQLGAYIGRYLVGIDNDLKLTKSKLIDHWFSGNKECYEITTQSGRKIVCSNNHRFKSFGGWKILSNLQIGDHIATNRVYNITNNQSTPTLNNYEAELLGILLGDGAFNKHTTCVHIADDEPEIKRRVERLIKSFDNDMRLSCGPSNKKKTGKNYRIAISASHDNDPKALQRTNPVSAMVQRFGLSGCTIDRKFMPPEIFHMPQRVWINLISGFWQANGWVCISKSDDNRKDKVEIGCYNISKNLIYSLQHLLLRLNIRSKVQLKNALCNTTQTRHPAWILSVYAESHQKFIDVFKENDKVIKKSKKISTIGDETSKQIFASRNQDLIPGAIWQEEILNNIPTGDWRKIAPNGLKRYCLAHRKYTHDTSREIIQHFGDALNNTRLRNLGTSDIIWDKIASIVKVGPVETYDIEVETRNGEPNFSANDIITHNSSITQAILWCLSGKTMYKKNPGNGILNRFTKNDCVVSIQFCDKSELTRVRRRNGDTELLYSKDGKRIIDCTLSTTSNQQKQLNDELQFDYDIFCGSVFFNQFNNPWMEMSDQVRKQTIEHIMGIDRLSIYAESANKKRNHIKEDQSKLKVQIDGLQIVINNLNDQIITTKYLSDKFSDNKVRNIQIKLDESNEFQQQADKFEIIDIRKLAKQWAIIEAIKTKIKVMCEESHVLKQQINDLKLEYKNSKDTLDEQISIAESNFEVSVNTISDKHDAICKELKAKHNATIKIIQQKQSITMGTIIGVQSTIDDIEKFIKLWYSKKGQICVECEQKISETHTTNKIEPKLIEKEKLQQQIIDAESTHANLKTEFDQLSKTNENLIAQLDSELNTKIKQLRTEHDTSIKAFHDKSDIDNLLTQIEHIKTSRNKLDEDIVSISNRLKDSSPPTTIREAKAENAKQDIIIQQVDRLKSEAIAIENECNPHIDLITGLESKIAFNQNKLDKVNNDIDRYDLVYAHFQYIYRAYSDRKKIKSFMVRKHKSYFNSRLGHYLDSFDLDIKIQLTDSLGLDSNLWGYDFQSGGERARTNLAFLFAIFDLYSRIHGYQCNVLVLDEPDHHLDDAGRAALIEIINNDLACRFGTIFIISHNNAFKDVFPSQLTIKRIDRLSYLDESR